MEVLVVGTRGSRLALWQTEFVLERLRAIHSGIEFRTQIISTTGDSVQDRPLAAIGDRGLFVREIELALLDRRIDLAVHSAKDLPSRVDNTLEIAAYPEREDPRDALVSRAATLADLPPGARIGTSSTRRRAQLLAARPDLSVVDLRGNLDTRLRKARSGDYDAAVLALAGLKRMGWESEVSEVLNTETCLPAVGQGALAVQCRSEDPACEVVACLDHFPTRVCVTAERAMLQRLGAGCTTPAAGLATIIGGRLRLDALVAEVTGRTVLRSQGEADVDDASTLGVQVAEQLLAQGAAELIESSGAGPTSMGAA